MGEKTRLFLHVGTHKTATTMIQACLNLDRRTLARDGIFYPSHLPAYPREAFSRTAAHHRFAHSVCSEAWSSAISRQVFARQVKLSGLRARSVILSSEAMYRHLLPRALARSAEPMDRHRAYFERLSDLLSGFDVVPIVYFRDPHAFAESIYKENLAKARKPMAEFGTFAARDRHIFDYAGHLDLLKEVFGSVQVRKYEDDARAGIVSAFYDLVGAGIAPSIPNDRTRVSLSNRAAVWLQEANAPDDELRFARQVYAAADPDGCFMEEQKSTLWADEESSDAFADRYARSFSLAGMNWPTSKRIQPVDWCDVRRSHAARRFEEWFSQNRSFVESCRKRGLEASLIQLRTPGLQYRAS